MGVDCLNKDVCSVVADYCDPSSLRGLHGLSPDMTKAVDERIVQQFKAVMNIANSGLSRQEKLNDILHNRNFYLLPPQKQDEVLNIFNPSGEEIVTAFGLTETLYFNKLPQDKVPLSEKYETRLMEALGGRLAAFAPGSVLDIIQKEWIEQTKEILMKAFFHQGKKTGEVFINHLPRDNRPTDAGDCWQPETIQKIVEGAKTAGLKKLIFKGYLTEESFKVLKTSGLEIDARQTVRPIKSRGWFVFAQNACFFCAMIGVAVLISVLGASGALAALGLAALIALIIGLAIGGVSTTFIPNAVYAIREKIHSRYRHFIPEALLNNARSI